MSSLISGFATACANHRDRPAVILPSAVVPFFELEGHVHRLAAWLEKQGLSPGCAVGIALADEYRHLVASLALMRLGCPQVGLSRHDPPSMRRTLAARCGVAAVLADGSGGHEGLEEFVPDYEAVLSDPSLDGATLPTPSDETVAVYLGTSGTTGGMKIVALSHGAFMRQAITRKMPFDGAVEYILSPLEFLYPKKHRLRSVVTGFTSLYHPADPEALPDLCARYGVDILRLSPPQAQALLDAADRNGLRLPERTALFVGGARISGSMRQAFREGGVAALHVEYGATECGNIAVAGPELHADHPDAVGRALPGVDIEVVDGEGRPVPAGIEGFVRIRTPGMAQGYLGDEALSKAAFRDGWYHSNDRGCLTPDGILLHGGRADDMMILNSINIHPAEIERLAEAYPGVVECAAFPLRSAVHGDIPMLAVVARGECDLKALLAHCRERLGVRAPRRVVAVDALPRNGAGKVLRGDLTERAKAGEWK
jgi:acyl-coenzyme A synthetase/AMP-(fatty) acid ligase